jgi:hypothetical protein
LCHVKCTIFTLANGSTSAVAQPVKLAIASAAVSRTRQRLAQRKM